MSRRTPIRRRIGPAAALAILLLVPPAIPRAAHARDLFPGYPNAVRAQAERVVGIAVPGKETALATEVRLLRVRMHGLGILSMNAIPDILFERAVREGWKKEAAPVLRTVREVAPFSVPMWAWLVKEDLLHFRLPDLLQDMEGLSGSLQRFGPALVGYVAWLVSFFSAVFCWFAVWGSASLFLRARPSLEGDFSRFLRGIPFRDYLAPILAVLVFVLPLLAGFGLAVTACIWLVLSADISAGTNSHPGHGNPVPWGAAGRRDPPLPEDVRGRVGAGDGWGGGQPCRRSLQGSGGGAGHPLRGDAFLDGAVRDGSHGNAGRACRRGGKVVDVAVP
jgi:hypothetical protein